MWWKREFRAGEVWQYGVKNMFVVLDSAEWDIRHNSPDTDNDLVRVFFLEVDGGFSSGIRSGAVGTMHRCSDLAEHSRRFA